MVEEVGCFDGRDRRGRQKRKKRDNRHVNFEDKFSKNKYRLGDDREKDKDRGTNCEA